MWIFVVKARRMKFKCICWVTCSSSIYKQNNAKS